MPFIKFTKTTWMKTINSQFQVNDPSLESQWRAIILFGDNTATYKFAFAKALLEQVEMQKSEVRLEDLALPFAKPISEHLAKFGKQGTNNNQSPFIDACRKFGNNEIDESALLKATLKDGFKYVIDAFHNVNGAPVPIPFYEKNFDKGNKKLILTDDILSFKDKFQFQNLEQEVEARWNLVETAWNLNINPSFLEVKYDENNSMFFLELDMRRKDVTSVRDSLNGYQKGKCFYSFQDISINKTNKNTCHVDHFFPHRLKTAFAKGGINVNGVWNLVLADPDINGHKSAKIPEERFLERLYNRNEFYISSKHPLAETIINQTGQNSFERRKFLYNQYAFYKNFGNPWKPEIELPGNF